MLTHGLWKHRTYIVDEMDLLTSDRVRVLSPENIISHRNQGPFPHLEAGIVYMLLADLMYRRGLHD